MENSDGDVEYHAQNVPDQAEPIQQVEQPAEEIE
jgi:hypothetical protein